MTSSLGTLRHSVSLLACALLALTACSDKDSTGTAGDPAVPDTVTIEVETVAWNGWAGPDAPKPTPTTETVDVAEGDTFEVHVLGGEATVEVLEIREDGVDLATSERFSSMTASGGYDLNDPGSEFTLTEQEPLELATPTMDAGTYVTLRLVATGKIEE